MPKNVEPTTQDAMDAVCNILKDQGPIASPQLRNLLNLNVEGYTAKRFDNLLQRMKQKQLVKYSLSKHWSLFGDDRTAKATPPTHDVNQSPMFKKPETSDNGASNEGEEIDMDNASDSDLENSHDEKDALDLELESLSESLEPADQGSFGQSSVLTQEHLDAQVAENKRLREVLDEIQNEPRATGDESWFDNLDFQRRLGAVGHDEPPVVLSFNVKLDFTGDQIMDMGDEQLADVMAAMKVLLDSKRGPILG